MDKQAQTQERRSSRSCHKTNFFTEVLATVKTKGKSFTSSYEEKITFNIESINGNYRTSIILIFNCGKSLCEALLLSNPRISSNHETINSIISSIFTQCISSHSDISGNEWTDRAAKEATLSPL